MTRIRPSTGDESLLEARVIPFGRSFRRLHLIGVDRRASSRVIRPIDVVMLLPFIIPLVAAILLGLLGWFVAWLAIVGMLVAAIVFGDLARGLWRRNGRTLDRRALG